MANDCCGVMRVVSKNKEALERLNKIMNYEDNEFFLYRVRDFTENTEPVKEGDFWCQDFSTDAAWASARWFDDIDQKDDLIVRGYEKKTIKLNDGSEREVDDYEKPIHGTAHFSSFPHVCKALDIGVELFATEEGIGFCEYAWCDHNGTAFYETENYSCNYPVGEDGECDYDAEPVIENGFGDDFEKFSDVQEIYENS